MVDLPLTTTRLLDCLCSPASAAHSDGAANGNNQDSGAAWKEIDARYRPVLVGLTRSLGLSQADAEDAAQWTLAEFAKGLREGVYQRGKGRLRSWVMGIARHRALMIKRASARRPHVPANAPDLAPLPETPDAASLDAVWEREVERAVFARAWELAQLRFAPETLRAFELVAMRGVPAEAAARECQLSVESIYASKSRVTRALKELALDLSARYDQDQ